jgi:hypothetical protein
MFLFFISRILLVPFRDGVVIDVEIFVFQKV